jgi:hypothetical protein
VNSVSIEKRQSKVNLAHLAPPPTPIPLEFLDRFPQVLAANSLRKVVTAVARAKWNRRPVIIGFGAHLIKCGLSPILIDLVNRGVVTGLATNGASVIHDVELALFGHTSEDVMAGLHLGEFGMTRETGDFLVQAIERNVNKPFPMGLGAAVGMEINMQKREGRERSLFAQSVLRSAQPTVHVAIGTDTLHTHPHIRGELLGVGSMKDFETFVSRTEHLNSGGVFINFGSAVIIPEVFLKALSLHRNRQVNFIGAVAANFDMIQHYRPNTRIVDTIQQLGGCGYAITGHHEIMLPLLAGLVLGALEEGEPDEKVRGVQDTS